MESNRKKRSGFKPPIKGSNASSKTHSHTMDRVCHTVLSYCSEGNAEDQYDVDTQPLSMFSGERKGEENEETIGELDDLLFQLDDPFSDTHSSEKLDDPYKVLDDSFSLSGSHTSPMMEEEIATSDEQIVPGSPPCKHPEVDGREGSQVRGGSMGTETGASGESEGLGLFPKRQFKVPAKSSRHYNLDLLPKHYRKGIRRSTTGGGKLSVNWAGNVSISRDLSRETAGGGEKVPMGVYEVPLSAEDYRKTSKPGRRSRNNHSLLKPDISFRSRTKEEQASHS